METDICRESNMTGPAQYKGPQCSQAGPVPLALAASLGLNWEGPQGTSEKVRDLSKGKQLLRKLGSGKKE